MWKYCAIIFILTGMAGFGYAKNNQKSLPVEVARFLADYNNDFTAKYGPLYAQNSIRFLSDSINISDIKVGRVLEIYRFKDTFLDAHPDTVPFSELIEPSGYYFVLITAHDKPLYELSLDNTNGTPGFIGMGYLNEGSLSENMWKELLEIYPEANGSDPVYFTPQGYPMHNRESFLYFQQKGPRTVYHVCPKFDGLSGARYYDSMTMLEDSKNFVKNWKAQGLNEVGPEVTKRRIEDTAIAVGNEKE